MEKITSRYPHLHLYLYQNQLFVWSRNSGSLYGFKEESAALFLTLEIAKEPKKVCVAPHSKKLAEQIMMLLEEEEKSQEKVSESYEWLFALSAMEKAHGLIYKIEDWCFCLDVKDEAIIQTVLPILEHLRSESICDYALKIQIASFESVYYIVINRKIYKETTKIEHIVPILQDILRLAYSQRGEYMISIHSAALAYKEKALLLPGVSGSGKSTLSAFLARNDFEIFSDELALIDKQGYLQAIALGLSIKEGSWGILENHYPCLAQTGFHLRFDLQRVKIVPPVNLSRQKVNLQGGYIIFPTYKKGANTSLHEIDLLQTIELIVNTQYHLYNLHDETLVESWLQFAKSCKTYTLTYGNIYKAKQIIKEVMCS